VWVQGRHALKLWPPPRLHRAAASRRPAPPQEANFETILRLGFRYSMGTIGGGRDAKGQLFLDDMAGAFKVAFEILSSKKANDKKLFKKKAAAEEPAHQTFVALWELSEALLVHSRAVGLAPGDPEVGAHLLQARDPATGQPLSDEKLAAEITILLIAGHETSSHTTSMALPLLAMNPQALARVEEELRG
jgi:cytochrome P450